MPTNREPSKNSSQKNTTKTKKYKSLTHGTSIASGQGELHTAGWRGSGSSVLNFMNDDYRELRRLLASYLKHIAKIGEASTLQILFLLKTERQIFTMMDYIDKRRYECLTEEHLLDVAIAIVEQVK